MNREHWKQLLPVIQAFVEGRTIQGRLPGIPWEDINDKHVVSFQGGEYRIKPTPKLRPWRPEEVPVGAVVVQKSAGNGREVIGKGVITGSWLAIRRVDVSGHEMDLQDLFDNFSLLDGSPCGVEE